MNLPDPKDAAAMTKEHYDVQAAFVAAYLVEKNAAKAAKAVGYTGRYPGKKGEAILGWPGTKKFIREQLEAAAVVHQITRERLIGELWEQLQEAKNAEVQKPYDTAKILEMLWKRVGYDDVQEDKEIVVKIKKFE